MDYISSFEKFYSRLSIRLLFTVSFLSGRKKHYLFSVNSNVNKLAKFLNFLIYIYPSQFFDLKLINLNIKK